MIHITFILLLSICALCGADRRRAMLQMSAGTNAAGGGSSAYAFVTNAIATGADAAATSGVDTTGAKLIVISAGAYSTITNVSDSKGNTWTALTERGTAAYPERLYYCINPTVGSGHTFTLTADYGVITMTAWSHTGTPVIDEENGATTPSETYLATGSVTPDGDGELFVAGWVWTTGADTLSVNSSFTISDQAAFNSALAGGMAYKIQTSASAENPTGTLTSAGTVSAAIAVFK